MHTLTTLDGECSKVKGSWSCCVAMSVKMVCSLGYLSAENINLCVCACQNILLSVCVLAVLSSLPVEDNSVSCIIFLHSSSSAHAHKHTHRRSTSLCLRFQSLNTHKPTSLSFEPTYSISIGWHSGTSKQIAAPGYLQESDIYGSCFFSRPHFAWNTFGFQRPCVIPDACQKKFEVLTKLLPDF